MPQSKDELALKIKVDPDKLNPPQSPWHEKHHFHTKSDLCRGVTKPENVSPLSPTLNSSLIHSPSPQYPPIFSSTSFSRKSSERLQDSSSASLHPLPSYSSSFLCPSPTPPFSSSIHPLPSSICSLPSSPAGGRKGRVCCGVCGKSFYDKGEKAVVSVSPIFSCHSPVFKLKISLRPSADLDLISDLILVLCLWI